MQYADVAPTLLELAAGDGSKENFDGISFAKVLAGKADSHRQYAYGVHNNLPEGPAYPIRTITDGKFRYIRNLRPDEMYIEKHLMGTQGNGRLNNPYWATWVFESWKDARTYGLVKRYTVRPSEELYHTAQDPYELTNLAANTEMSSQKKRLASELDAWMIAQGDPGADQDTTEALEAARSGKHLYGPDG